jgi:O-antigen/teichoic acid export membrane protein
MRRPWVHIFQTGGASLVNAGASAAVLAITARLLGPEGRGTYAVATTWVLMFSTLGSLNLAQSVVHSIAGRDAEGWLPTAAGTLFALLGLITVVDFAVVALAYVPGDGQLFRHLSAHVLLVAFAALPFLIANVNLPYILYALDALRVANRAQIAGATGLLTATIILVGPLRLGVTGALISFAVGAACTTAVAGSYLVRRAVHLRVDWVLARQMLVGSGQLHLNTIGSYLLTQSSVLILNQFRPIAETGQYQLAIQLFSFSLLFSNAMGTVAYGLVATKGPDAAWPEQWSLIKQGLVLAVVAMPVGYVLAPVVIRLAAGQAFLPSIGLFRWLLPAAVGATFSAMMASQWIGRRMLWHASALTIVTGVISVGFDLVLIPRYGTQGAVVSTLVTYGIATLASAAMAIWVDRQVSALEHGVGS